MYKYTAKSILICFVLMGMLLNCDTVTALLSVQYGESGKCGRDCVYYVCHKLGIQTTLKEIDSFLDFKKNVSMFELRQTFEAKGLLCRSYSFDSRSIKCLKYNLDRGNGHVYAVIACPNVTNSSFHYAIVHDISRTTVTVYDVSNNKLHSIDISDYYGHNISVPVIIVSNKETFLSNTIYLRSHLLDFSLYTILLVICVFVFKNYKHVIYRIAASSCLLLSRQTYKQRHIKPIMFFIILMTITVIIIVSIFYMKKNDNPSKRGNTPVKALVETIDLGKIQLFTSQRFIIPLRNITTDDVTVARVQVSCSCIEIIKQPNIIPARGTSTIEAKILPLLENEATYQILIKPEYYNPFVVKVRYEGIQKMRLLPKYFNVGVLNSNNSKQIECVFQFDDYNNHSLVVDSITFYGDEPILPRHQNLWVNSGSGSLPRA